MSARLVLLGDEDVSIALPINQQISFGRKTTNTFITDHMMCSSLHAVLVFDGNDVSLTDSSSNGTFVNDVRVIRGVRVILSPQTNCVVEFGRMGAHKSPYIFRLDVSGEIPQELEMSVLTRRCESLEHKIKETLENMAAMSYTISDHQRREQELRLRLDHASQQIANLNSKNRQLEDSLLGERRHKNQLTQHLDHITSTLTSLLVGQTPSSPCTQVAPHLTTQVTRKSLSQMDVSENEDSLFGPNHPSSSHLHRPSTQDAAHEQNSEPEDLASVLNLNM